MLALALTAVLAGPLDGAVAGGSGSPLPPVPVPPVATAPGVATGAAGVPTPRPVPTHGRRAPVHTLWTIAGGGAGCAAAPDCGDGGPATSAQISYPQGLVVAADGAVFVADYGDSEVRRISPDGRISVVAGDGTPCQTAPSCGDGGPATAAQLAFPTAVALDSRGNLYIADAGDDEVRRVAPGGVITRVAGTGVDCADGNPCGDGGPALSARLSSPDGLVVTSGGDIYIADTGDNEIRKVSRTGKITTVAGDGSQCAAAPACGDGGSATAAQLNFPEAVTLDARGHLYIADNGDDEVRAVIGGRIQRVAGTGAECAAAPACGDGGAAVDARLTAPAGLAFDRAGNLYVADWGDDEIRAIDPHGTISRVAGSGAQCAAAPACGDAGAALSAQLSSPHGVAIDAAGNLYIGDAFDDEVRLLAATTAGPARAHDAAGTLALLALGADTGRTSVTLPVLLSRTARLSLWVSQGNGRRLLASRASGAAGLQELAWNRRLGRRAAPRGRYTLSITATAGHLSVSATLAVTL